MTVIGEEPENDLMSNVTYQILIAQNWGLLQLVNRG